MFHPVIWKRYISSENRRRIFQVIVEVSVAYTSETWTMNKGLHSSRGGNAPE